MRSNYDYEGVAGGALLRIAGGTLIVRATEETLNGLRLTIERALAEPQGVAGAHVLTSKGVSECIVEVQERAE